MKNGKIAKTERKVRRNIVMLKYVEQKSLAFMSSTEERIEKYRAGGMSQLIDEALKAKLGVEDE